MKEDPSFLNVGQTCSSIRNPLWPAWDLQHHHMSSLHVCPFHRELTKSSKGNIQTRMLLFQSPRSGNPKVPPSVYQTHNYSWRSVLKICKLPAITLAGRNHLLVLMEAVKMKMTLNLSQCSQFTIFPL